MIGVLRTGILNFNVSLRASFVRKKYRKKVFHHDRKLALSETLKFNIPQDLSISIMSLFDQFSTGSVNVSR